MRKRCNRCKKSRLTKFFSKNVYSPDGLYSLCHKCRFPVSKRYRISNKKRLYVYQKNWVKKNRNKTRIYVKEYREKNIDKVRRNDKLYKRKLRKDPKYSKINRDSVKRWRLRFPDKHKSASLRWRVGISLDDYKVMMKKQNNKCAICGKHQKTFKKFLSVDHCHRTKKVRGILCHKCNFILGFAFDNKRILRNAISYLEKYDK